MAVLPWVHAVLFALWLGGDMGVYATSRLLRQAQWPPPARVALARAMTLIDLAPRTALVLILPTGLAMALGHRGAHVAALVTVAALGVAWWALALAAWRRQRTPLRWLTSTDAAVRVLVGTGLAGLGLWGVLGSSTPGWLAGKELAYGLCVLAGLMIRVRLRPFGPAFARVAAGAGTAAEDRAIDSSLRSAMPFVLAIWGLVLLASFLGVVQPG